MQYNDNNDLEATFLPNGVIQDLDYQTVDGNRTSRLRAITAGRDPADPTVTNLEWSYRDAGAPAGATEAERDRDLRQTLQDDRLDRRTTYSYDHLNRLTDARTYDRRGTRADETDDRLIDHYRYGYDRNSNRLLERVVNGSETQYNYNAANELTCRYGAATHQSSCPTGATTYSYDQNGNLTGSSAGLALTYNARNQTTSVRPGAGAAPIALAYTGPGQRERTERGGERFTSSQLGLSHWLRADGKTNYVTRDPRGALVGQRTPDKGRHRYLSDSLGTIVAMTDERGDVSARYAYEPFGSPLASSSESVPSPFRFTGQVYDAAYGFYKLGLRYMASSQGRFTQNDPLVGFQDPRRANRYIYAGQDPVNMVDPSGLHPCPASIEGNTPNCGFDGDRTGQGRGWGGFTTDRAEACAIGAVAGLFGSPVPFVPYRGVTALIGCVGLVKYADDQGPIVP